ncbi:hypothetical protein [Xanthomonas maliensis]|uniref:hypothetical protein n=1 Tax=Xanthomonas maliensis TaxID=1321368 RepID=UPI001FD0F470|nr:hypothetical protein [Xanthomonas maliensis]
MKNANTWLKPFCVVAGLFASGAAMADCCPSGGVGTAAIGLGDSNPKAANLAMDPSLAIYEFHRDGVTYLQINDVTGVVHAVVARVDDALWTLPMGKDVNRVVLPTKNKISDTSSSESTTSDAGQRNAAQLVYKTRNFTVLTRRAATGDQWIVSP